MFLAHELQDAFLVGLVVGTILGVAILREDAAIRQAISNRLGVEVLHIQDTPRFPEGKDLLDLAILHRREDAPPIGVNNPLVLLIDTDAADRSPTNPPIHGLGHLPVAGSEVHDLIKPRSCEDFPHVEMIYTLML